MVLFCMVTASEILTLGAALAVVLLLLGCVLLLIVRLFLRLLRREFVALEPLLRPQPQDREVARETVKKTQVPVPAPKKKTSKCPHCQRFTEMKQPVREVVNGEQASLVYECEHCTKEYTSPVKT